MRGASVRCALVMAVVALAWAAPATAAPLLSAPKLTASGTKATVSVKLREKARVRFALCPARKCKRGAVKLGAARGKGRVRRTVVVPKAARGRSWFLRACVERRCVVTRRRVALGGKIGPPSPTSPELPTQPELAAAIGGLPCATVSTAMGDACVPEASGDALTRALVLRAAQALPADLRPTEAEVAALPNRRGVRQAGRIVTLNGTVLDPPTVSRCPDPSGGVSGTGTQRTAATLTVGTPSGTGIVLLETTTAGLLSTAHVADDARFKTVDYLATVGTTVKLIVQRPDEPQAQVAFAVQVNNLSVKGLPRDFIDPDLVSRVQGTFESQVTLPPLLYAQLRGYFLAFGEAAVRRAVTAYADMERLSWYAGECVDVDLARAEQAPSRGGTVTQTLTLRTPPPSGTVRFQAHPDDRAVAPPGPDGEPVPPTSCPGVVQPAEGEMSGSATFTVSDTTSAWGRGCVSAVVTSRMGRGLAFDEWQGALLLDLKTVHHFEMHVDITKCDGWETKDKTSDGTFETTEPVVMEPSSERGVVGDGTWQSHLVWATDDDVDGPVVSDSTEPTTDLRIGTFWLPRLTPVLTVHIWSQQAPFANHVQEIPLSELDAPYERTFTYTDHQEETTPCPEGGTRHEVDDRTWTVTYTVTRAG